MGRHKLYRILKSTGFSLFFLLVLIGGMAAVAYYVTETFQEEPDFGGMVTIRQSNMDVDSTSAEATCLTRSMILSHITREDVLLPIAKEYGWEASYNEMVQSVDVKERLSSHNSYIIIANTRNAERSVRVARALTLNFLNHYRKNWEIRSRKTLIGCEAKITELEKELCSLNTLRLRFQDKNELRPLNTEIEMKALNDQLVEAQNQFLTAYGVYVSRMELKRSEAQLELDLALQIRTDDDTEIKNMRRKVAELERQSAQIQQQLAKQKPDLYRMTAEPPKLTGLPSDVVYFYENIQNLQQIKLALMLGSIIEEKEKMLEREQKRKNTIERLLDSNSCDVFIREVAR